MNKMIRLIYAEDDPFMHELTMEALEDAMEDDKIPNIEIVHVEHAEELQNALHKAFADAVPFIILSDENMPRGSGSSAIASFLSDEKHQDIDWEGKFLDLAIVSGITPFDSAGNFITGYLSKTQQDLFVIMQGMKKELKFFAKPTAPNVLINFLNEAVLPRD